MKTEKIGVITILKDGELFGIIYNDIEKRNKVMYKCTPMTEEEMVEIIEKTI